MSLRVVVSKERLCRWRWWKTRSQDHEKQSLVVERERGGKGMKRAEHAEGAAWLQWRKVARKEYKRRKAVKKER